MKIPGGFDSLSACFAIRDFRLYFIGNIAHGLGVWVLRVTMGWLAWELTDSTAWLGGIVLAETAPTMALALIAGTVVDRVDYFKLLRICQGFSMFFAATLAILTLTGLINIWLMFFLTIFRRPPLPSVPSFSMRHVSSDRRSAGSSSWGLGSGGPSPRLLRCLVFTPSFCR
jgi:hypothetical protein